MTDLSLSELFARLRKLDAERDTVMRMIEAKGLRLEKEQADREEAAEQDWTRQYKGLTGRILSAIWNAPKHRLTTIKICEAGWNDGGISQNTFWTTIGRVNKKLAQNKSVFFVTSIP